MNGRIRHSHKKNCPYKEKLELTNAQEYLLAAQKDTKHYRDPATLELYVCTACGFLHIGHGQQKRQSQ